MCTKYLDKNAIAYLYKGHRSYKISGWPIVGHTFNKAPKSENLDDINLFDQAKEGIRTSFLRLDYL